MRRLLPIAVLFAVSPFAVPAPIPKDETQAQKLERLFGKPIQAEGTKIELNGDKLRLSASSEKKPVHSGSDLLDISVAVDAWTAGPRTERRVDGDFEVTVRVTPSEKKGEPVSLMAGLQVRFGTGDFFAYLRNIGETERVMLGAMRDGESFEATSKKVPPKPPATVSLRITRRGDKLTGHVKHGDGDWTAAIERSSKELPKQVTVGVYLHASATTAAEFEDFAVTPLK